MPDFPQLPIITLTPAAPEPPRKTQAEKYGGLFYFAIAGLVTLVALIAYFGVGVWSMRDVWAEIYAVNDPKRPEADRLDAALALSRDSRVSSRQKWDLALSRVPPEPARYLLAESLGSDAMASDPRGYALSISRSEGWPDWLRLLLARPLAYGAGEGYDLPRVPLEELAASKDPILGLWARYTMAVSRAGDFASREVLVLESRPDGPRQELANLLSSALVAAGPARSGFLDRATAWCRLHHPDAKRVWEGWDEREGRFTKGPIKPPA